MKKAPVPTLLVAALVLFTTTVLTAQPLRQEERVKRREQRSENVRKRIELIIARFENNKKRHIAVYDTVKADLKKLGDALDARGYDTSRLREDYRELDSKIRKFAQDYAAFIALLEETLAYDPITTGGQFKDAIAAARRQLRAVHRDVLDIRHHYQTVVRPDIQKLREQNPGGGG